mmetsp:Transcript_81242/g.230585  ORF Transcript_81242/g.230585 Transcript_81242/m.230585 type:complete len:303 (+) Transcript_81242:1297-2205(+)
MSSRYTISTPGVPPLTPGTPANAGIPGAAPGAIMEPERPFACVFFSKPAGGGEARRRRRMHPSALRTFDGSGACTHTIWSMTPAQPGTSSPRLMWIWAPLSTRMLLMMAPPLPIRQPTCPLETSSLASNSGAPSSTSSSCTLITASAAGERCRPIALATSLPDLVSVSARHAAALSAKGSTVASTGSSMPHTRMVDSSTPLTLSKTLIWAPVLFRRAVTVAPPVPMTWPVRALGAIMRNATSTLPSPASAPGSAAAAPTGPGAAAAGGKAGTPMPAIMPGARVCSAAASLRVSPPSTGAGAV